mmetsp:Transcript_124597/g.360373  ORF Transcript_124597/g.360373 Transcript_124597/m.360373 type:complete len:264 (+) Transcript_124597:204-995(+)
MSRSNDRQQFSKFPNSPKSFENSSRNDFTLSTRAKCSCCNSSAKSPWASKATLTCSATASARSTQCFRQSQEDAANASRHSTAKSWRRWPWAAISAPARPKAASTSSRHCCCNSANAAPRSTRESVANCSTRERASRCPFSNLDNSPLNSSAKLVREAVSQSNPVVNSCIFAALDSRSKTNSCRISERSLWNASKRRRNLAISSAKSVSSFNMAWPWLSMDADKTFNSRSTTSAADETALSMASRLTSARRSPNSRSMSSFAL